MLSFECHEYNDVLPRHMPGKLNLNTTTETDTCRRIRPGVLVNSDNAAMYVEYGKHPLGLTDVDIPEHEDHGYRLGPVSTQADNKCALKYFMLPPAVQVTYPATLSKNEPGNDSSCFQITFDARIPETIATFERAYEQDQLVNLKYALLQSAVDTDAQYVLMFAIVQAKRSNSKIIGALPAGENRTDVCCIMKIGTITVSRQMLTLNKL